MTTEKKKRVIINELEQQGVIFEALKEDLGKDLDPFDMICHIVCGQPPLTRAERANHVKKRNYFSKYGEKAQIVLNAILNKYADEGIETIEDPQILTINPLSDIGTTIELVKAFGGKEKYKLAIQELEQALYNQMA